ncbi:dethiobiotin synthase [Sulfurimonas marina]|uniref:ATP-dependent dethiobiotin synthetase BioD n=1 Tax=Sulfurimonas marina TaxID=2590551 RepID=A0A7M1AW99_9BACT|nr:dethiobiotin synthase [Sulfurimonas marina]QOP40652.1 dethiobiotin synthase [Sulfurimonas marina]
MAKRIFITATNTDIGKTYTTKLLMQELASQGYKVGVIKPIETGVKDGVYPDGDALLTLLKQINPLAWSLDVENIVPISYELPAAPVIASHFGTIDYKKIDEAIKEQEAMCDILLIEGAGGLFVPVDEKIIMIDLIKVLNAQAVLVTHCSLGCISDTLVNKKALDDSGIKNEVLFNCRDEEKQSFKEISLPYFQKRDFDVFTTAEIEKLVAKIVEI